MDLDDLVAMAVARVARSLGGADADDVKAVVMARVWRAMESVPPDVVDRGAWLERAAERDAMDEARTIRRASRLLPKALPGDLVAHRDGLRQVDDEDEVAVLLERMTARQREVMRRHLNGDRQVDVAERLGISHGRVGQIEEKARARAKSGRATR